MIKSGTEVPDSVNDFVPVVLSRLVKLDSGESYSVRIFFKIKIIIIEGFHKEQKKHTRAQKKRSPQKTEDLPTTGRGPKYTKSCQGDNYKKSSKSKPKEKHDTE